MNSKIKILIGILILGILVFLGLFAYFVYFGGGCVDSDEQCAGKPDGTSCTSGVWCDSFGRVCGGQSCVGLGTGVCANNKCVMEGVTIITDETEYKQGETVKITVSNNLGKPVWHWDFDPGCHRWWGLEKWEAEAWKLIQVFPPITTKYGEECISCPPPLDSTPIEELVSQVKPGSAVSDTWNLKNCEVTSGELNLTFIETGIYRFSFSYGFSEGSCDEKTIYSGGFTVKKE